MTEPRPSMLRRLLTHPLLRGAEARNLTWLFAEYSVRIGVVLIATALVARHLGPEDFAIFGLLFTLITAIIPLTDAGLSHLISRVIVAEEAPLTTILGTSAALRLVFCLLGIPVIGVLALFSENEFPGLTAFALLAGALNALSSLAVIDYYFQSQLQARLAVIARTAALLIVSGSQILFIVIDAPVWAFLLTLAVKQPLFGILYYLMFRLTKGPSILRWRVDLEYGRSLFRRSFRLLISNTLIGISTRVPIIFLASLGTATSVGLLTAAIRPIQMLTVLPTALASTLLPRFVRTHRDSPSGYEKVLRVSALGFTVLSLLFAAVFFFGAPLIVDVFYGPEFADAVWVMQIASAMLIFIFLRAILTNWYVTEEAYTWSVGSYLLGAITAFAGGWILISNTPTAPMTAAVLVAQGIAGSLLALVVTSRGRGYLRVVFGGRARRGPTDPAAATDV
ncbi:MAG: oligosaccharide flippase family protein [Acidimicrobiia bacterium]|nr:oligosaccharide flippase family protein [Acidimicrobiia bacterium]